MAEQARTEVTAIKFAFIKTSTPRCKADIRAGALSFSYKLRGSPAITINAGPNTPPPPPPAAEPALLPANDPVSQLILNGWKITESVPGQPAQPAGFGLGQPYDGGLPLLPRPPRGVIFESIRLAYEAPMFCTCTANNKCKVAKFKLEVNYDGIAHPVVKAQKSAEGACANYAALVANVELNTDSPDPTFNTINHTFPSSVTCDCPTENDEGGTEEEPGGPEEEQQGGEEEQQGDKCPIKIEVEYVYGTRVP